VGMNFGMVATGEVPVCWAAGYDLVLPDTSSPPAGGFPLLLCLHGFGEDRARFRDRLAGLFPAPFAALFADGPFPVEVMPSAANPERRVGHAWYHYSGDEPAFLRSMRFASQHLARVLERAAASHPVDLGRVCVLGYSQGGYLAGVMTLENHARYRGLVAMSCRIKVESVRDALSGASGFPVMVVHGRRDQATKIEPQRDAVRELQRLGLEVEFTEVDGGHGLRAELCAPVRAFVERVLL